MQDERQGQFILYSLDTTVLEEVLGWFLEFTGTGKESETHSRTESKPKQNKDKNREVD
ncbi:Transcriptional repressor SdpR [compost metagenome]